MKKQRISWLMLCVTLLLLVSVLLSCTAQNGNGSHTSEGETVSVEASEPLGTVPPEEIESEPDSESVSSPAGTDPTEETTLAPSGTTASDTTSDMTSDTTGAIDETSQAPETTPVPETTTEPETTPAPETTTEPETTPAPETTTEPVENLTYGSEIGDYCPIIPLEGYNGAGTVSLSDTRGRITVLNFWATWCPPCVSELLSEFPRVTEYYGDRVAIMAVHVTDVSANVQAYIDQNCKDFDIIFCQDEFLTPTSSYYTRAGGNGYIPYTLVLDETGRIVWKHVGATDFETLKGVIDGILNNK